MKTERPTTQIYSNYTSQDFDVWNVLFTRQLELLRPIVSEEYLKAIEIVKFNKHEIPDFKRIDHILSQYTGWSLVVRA